MPAFIQDLGIILLTASIVTLLFKKIGQPVVLGYLLAGFLLSPEVSFLPTVQEREAVKVWAEIGVIFLLFGLGLEFSFKKLMVVGKGASITALTEVVVMLGLGYLTGQAFGWKPMDSLFLGGILSISSTTIIIRAFDELGFRQKGFAQLVFGVLIVEDLVAVLLLVLLSTIAMTNTFEGVSLLLSAAKLVFFLSTWFIGGIFLVPWFLRKMRPLMNQETSLIVSLGLCLAMVLLATQAGFSPALGAFIMGSILAETPDGEKIEHNLTSVKNLFSAIFFVSVGMLIQIDPIKEHAWALVAITLVTLFGKWISSTIGALMGGQSIKTSIQTGMSLAQIGEFSFIIATLGLSLGVISEFLYPLAVTVSAITTLTTPYMIKYSEPFYEWVKPKLSQSLLNRAHNDVKGQLVTRKATIKQKETLRLFLNTTAIIAIGLFCKFVLQPFLDSYFKNTNINSFTCLILAIGLSLPSFWAVINGAALLKADTYKKEDIKTLTSQAVLAYTARILLSLFLLGFIIAQFISAWITFVLVASLTIAISFLGSKNFSKLYQWLENNFMIHLNEKEKLQIVDKSSPLLPWEAHLSQIEVPPDSEMTGQKIKDLHFRKNFGVTITQIQRGSRRIISPGPDEFIMAFDKLLVLGDDEQLSQLEKSISQHNQQSLEMQKTSTAELIQFVLTESHPWVGKTIFDSKIRETTDGLVVGLERMGQRYLNPDSNTLIQAMDTLWIVADPKKISSQDSHVPR